MRYAVRQFGQVAIRLVEAAVEPTLLDVKLLHHLPITLASLALPYLLKRLRVDVANAETLVQQMRRAGKHPTIGH